MIYNSTFALVMVICVTKGLLYIVQSTHSAEHILHRLQKYVIKTGFCHSMVGLMCLSTYGSVHPLT